MKTFKNLLSEVQETLELGKDIDLIFFGEDIVDEDAPTNSAGGGAVAGIGVGKDGEPGVGGPLLKRKPLDKFGADDVFEVNGDVFHNCMLGKNRYHRWDRYVGDDDTGHQIKEYGKANPKKPIILRNQSTGAMIYLRNKAVHNY